MSEAQAPRAFAIAQIAVIRVQHQAAARWLQGGLAVEGVGGLHEKNSSGEKTATRPTGADNTPLVCEAQHFFNFIFDGRPAASEGSTRGCR